MGISGGSTNTSQQQSGTTNSNSQVTMPSWLQPGVRRYFNQVTDLLGQGGPNSTDNMLASRVRAMASTPNWGMMGAQNATQGLLNYSPTQVSAGQLSQTDLSPYQNPWEDQVVQNSLSDLDRFRQGAITQNQASATQANSYGGSRHGWADAGTNEAALREASNLSAGLRSQGFLNAQDAARFDIGNRLGADTFNSQQGLAGAGLRLNAAGQLGDQSLAGSADQRANLGLLGMYGNPQFNRLQRVAGLLGINAGDLFGQRNNGSFESSGTGSSEQDQGWLGGLGSLFTGLGGLGLKI